MFINRENFRIKPVKFILIKKLYVATISFKKIIKKLLPPATAPLHNLITVQTFPSNFDLKFNIIEF